MSSIKFEHIRKVYDNNVEVVKEAANIWAVPVIDLNDSIRYLYDGGSQSVDRSRYKAVQTPQVFLRECILSAYNQPYEAAFTDDASVVEKAGHAIELTLGNRENIKITTPLDLRLAEWMLKDGLS